MSSKNRNHNLAFGHILPSLKFLTFLLAGVSIVFAFSGEVSAQPSAAGCGALDNGSNGPFDYRTERGSGLKTVEQFHFTPNIENLIGGNSAPLGAELDYTLRAFPNHHRALMAMMRLGEKLKSPQPAKAAHSVECYFERALRFRPDDSTARMIYATFLAKYGRGPEAIKQLEIATAAAGDNAYTHYNIGLIYFDIKDYDQALAQAHRAYGLGFVQPQLRDQLKNAGKWKELESQSTNASSQSAMPGSVDAVKPAGNYMPGPNKPDTEN